MADPQTGMTPPPGFDVRPSTKERVGGVIGAVLNHGQPGFDQTPLGKKLASIHSSRLNEAGMHHQNMSTYAGILATGIDPQTGQPLTDQQKQQYQDWYNAAKQSFVKAGGIDKDTKAHVNKASMITDAIIQHGQKSQQDKAAAGAAPTAGTPPASGGGGGGGMTPPPKASAVSADSGAAPASTPGTSSASPASPASVPYDTQTQLNAPHLRERMESQEAWGDEKRKLELQHKFKMEEAQAKPKHLQLKNFKRPGSEEIESGSFDPAEGKFFDQAGNEVEGALAVTPSAGQAKRFLYLDKTGEPRFGIQEGENLYDMEHKLLPPDTEPLMRGLIGTESVSKDQFGNVTITVRKPLVPGPGGAGPGAHGKPAGGAPASGAAPAAGGAGTPAGAPVTTPAPKTPPSAPAATGARPGAAAQPPAAKGPAQDSNNSYSEWGLSADGTIPATKEAGGNEQVRELAQRLLDGEDINKLPMKGRTPASELARKYGWSQGKFTPKEQVLLRESTTFLKQAAADEEYLKSFDGGFFSRMKAGQTALSPDKEGYIGRGLSTLAAEHLSEREAHSIEVNNQLVGTISGLSQLVRSNRATEATIDRLKAELPNLLTTKDSKHAKARLQRLLNEVNVAMEKGTFTGTAQTTGVMTPPPATTKPVTPQKKVLIEGKDFNVTAPH